MIATVKLTITGRVQQLSNQAPTALEPITVEATGNSETEAIERACRKLAVITTKRRISE